MGAKLDRWMVFGSAALLVGALLACKKDKEAEPEAEADKAAEEPAKAEEEKPAEAPKAEAEPEAEPAAAADDAGADDASPDAGEVEIKRYADQEQPATGKAKVIADKLAVYPEADSTKEKVVELDKDTVVQLKASYQEYYLIEYEDEAETDESKKNKLGWVPKADSVKKVVARAAPAAPTARERRSDIGGRRRRR